MQPKMNVHAKVAKPGYKYHGIPVLYHDMPSPPPKENMWPSNATADAYERAELIGVRPTSMSSSRENESRDDNQVTLL